MEIKIKDLHPSDYGDRFTAELVGILEIKGCQRKTGTSAKGTYDFISTPSRKITTKDGVEKWVNDLYLTKSTGDAILAAYIEHSGAADDKRGVAEYADDIPF